jgi:hypothetical protein
MGEFSPKELPPHFVLIRDFWPIYQDFAIRGSGIETDVEAIRCNMTSALASAVGAVDELDVDGIRSMELPIDPASAYVVTFDGGVLFPKHDYRIEITRACGRMESVITGNFIRLSRQFSPLLNQQMLSLSEDFKRSGKSTLVLCDDGIGTGGTFRRIIELCRSLGLPVGHVIALTNPKRLTQIADVPVVTLDPARSSFAWLNERDLFWGLPRSGLSVSEAHQFRAVGGVPYTLNEGIAVERIGIPEHSVTAFIEASLAINRDFYLLHEDQVGREITFREIPRLACLFDRGVIEEQRVTVALERLRREPDYRLLALKREIQSND